MFANYPINFVNGEGGGGGGDMPFPLFTQNGEGVISTNSTYANAKSAYISYGLERQMPSMLEETFEGETLKYWMFTIFITADQFAEYEVEAPDTVTEGFLVGSSLGEYMFGNDGVFYLSGGK